MCDAQLTACDAEAGDGVQERTTACSACAAAAIWWSSPRGSTASSSRRWPGWRSTSQASSRRCTLATTGPWRASPRPSLRSAGDTALPLVRRLCERGLPLLHASPRYLLALLHRVLCRNWHIPAPSLLRCAMWSAENSAMCRDIGATVLIDDNPRYAMECAAAGIDVLLYDWNDSYPWGKTAEG